MLFLFLAAQLIRVSQGVATEAVGLCLNEGGTKPCSCSGNSFQSNFPYLQESQASRHAQGQYMSHVRAMPKPFQCSGSQALIASLMPILMAEFRRQYRWRSTAAARVSGPGSVCSHHPPKRVSCFTSIFVVAATLSRHGPLPAEV